MTSLITLSANVLEELSENPIVFISDLHFDYTQGKYKVKAALRIKQGFISFLKTHHSKSIVCLAGDFFNNYKKTLSFVKELEKEQITGFFVLGNHDYWNNGTKSHEDIIDLFCKETQKHQHFKLLVTGHRYYYKGICVIGDTGWTSFRRKKRRVTLKQFAGLPDAIKVKDFSPKKIIALHDDWVSFANGVLNEEKKVLMITHFPMVDFTNGDRDCWWSSTTSLIDSENSWRIFGHTHRSDQQYNNISIQKGYNNRDLEELENKGLAPRISYSLGKLEKLSEPGMFMSSSNFQSISQFHSSIVVSDINTELELVQTLRRRGYKRCAANKYNFAVLAHSPEKYLIEVKEIADGYLREAYIGYTFSGKLSKRVLEAIYHSIAILESGDLSDIRAFITAAVITGYVYNRATFHIETMRPVDDYDVFRFWLMLLTIKQYDISIDSIEKVQSNPQNKITFCNLDVSLPKINGMSLDIKEGDILIQQLFSLPKLIPIIEDKKIN